MNGHIQVRWMKLNIELPLSIRNHVQTKLIVNGSEKTQKELWMLQETLGASLGAPRWRPDNTQVYL